MNINISFSTFVAQAELVKIRKQLSNRMNGSEQNIQSIKALIVFREDKDTDNLFVPILCDAIGMTGIDVRCSTKEFWESDTTYDIIHFQWPEEAVGWTCNDPDIIRRLDERIKFFRSRGAHFVYTRHNVRPHYSNDIINRAYDIIEAESDTVVHMGRYSRDEFAANHPGSRNVVIPHHIYENTYNENISKENARRQLKLPQDAFIITAFGKFRNREEIRMVLDAFRAWDGENKLLLAPRLFPFSRSNNYGGNLLKKLASRIGYHLLMPLLCRLWKLRAGANDELIDNADLPYYIAASDVIFIQRIDILNSGNVPLAFLFRKTVVGPEVGNIGEILIETGNATFDPSSTHSIVKAIQEAQFLTNDQQGEENYNYAIEHMNVRKIGQEYAQTYKDLVNGK